MEMKDREVLDGVPNCQVRPFFALMTTSQGGCK